MTEYKSIREWLAEGKERSELIGYVTPHKNVVTKFVTTERGETVTCLDPNADIEHEHFMVVPVAPPAPKRLSDEELLQQYSQACVGRTLDTASGLRSQILERMKGRGDEQLLEDVEGALYKGPTRGEVEDKLPVLLGEAYLSSADVSNKFEEVKNAFLSMFPKST